MSEIASIRIELLVIVSDVVVRVHNAVAVEAQQAAGKAPRLPDGSFQYAKRERALFSTPGGRGPLAGAITSRAGAGLGP